MSSLKIYRKGYQTWNDDFLQWLAQYGGSTGSTEGFSTEPVMNTDDFSGTIYLLTHVEGYYSLHGLLTNIVEVDTSQVSGGLAQEICDFNSIFSPGEIFINTQVCGVRDSSTYECRMIPIQYSVNNCKLYVCNGYTAPVGQLWSIDIPLYPTTLVGSEKLLRRVQRKMKTQIALH